MFVDYGWKQAQLLTRQALYERAVDLRDQGNENIRQVHDKEPADNGFLEDWPAFTMQQIGHSTLPPKGDYWFPNIVNFSFRIYYPVIEGGDRDGLKIAQELTIAGQADYLEYLFQETDELEGQTLNGEVMAVGVGDGRIVGAQVGATILQGYETDLFVQIH